MQNKTSSSLPLPHCCVAALLDANVPFAVCRIVENQAKVRIHSHRCIASQIASPCLLFSVLTSFVTAFSSAHVHCTASIDCPVIQQMVLMSVLSNCLISLTNAEKRGKRQVMIRPASKVVVKFLEVMLKHRMLHTIHSAQPPASSFALPPLPLPLIASLMIFRFCFGCAAPYRPPTLTRPPPLLVCNLSPPPRASAIARRICWSGFGCSTLPHGLLLRPRATCLSGDVDYLQQNTSVNSR